MDGRGAQMWGREQSREIFEVTAAAAASFANRTFLFSEEEWIETKDHRAITRGVVEE